MIADPRLLAQAPLPPSPQPLDGSQPPSPTPSPSAGAQGEGDELPYYARRNEKGFYTYKGRQLRSVTTYQSFAPGTHLIPWAGKMAILDAISLLVRSGVESDDPVIIEHCQGLIGERISRDEAIAAILDWKRRMVAHERYRDHKGRIGSLGHHFIWARALDLVAPDICRSEKEIKDWLWHHAISLRLFERASDPDYQPSEERIEALANSAYAYVLSADEWLNVARPRWNSIGQEAMVVRSDRGDGIEYAGTMDGDPTLIEGEYGYKWQPEWPEKEVSLRIDIKHSNAINHMMVQAQVAAYDDSDCIVLLQNGMEIEEYPLEPVHFMGSLHVGPHASVSQTTDEFGTLESKTNQIGAKLYTYPRDPRVLAGFHGLCRWVDYCENVPRAHQQRARRTEPKLRYAKTDVKPAPF